MDRCHLLLGRSWQYDRRVVHDGYKKIYSFVKDGTKIILGPSKIESAPKPSKGEQSNFLSKSQFDKELEGSGEAFVLVLLEENQKIHDIPPMMKLYLIHFMM